MSDDDTGKAEDELAHQLHGMERFASMADSLAEVGYSPAQLMELLINALTVIGDLAATADQCLKFELEKYGEDETVDDMDDDSFLGPLGTLLIIRDEARFFIDAGGIDPKDAEHAILFSLQYGSLRKAGEITWPGKSEDWGKP